MLHRLFLLQMNSVYKSITLILSSFLVPVLHAQPLDKVLNKEFLEAKELYLLDTEMTSVSMATSDGRTFTFEELVRENWPGKKVIKITPSKYDQLRQKNKKFHIYLAVFTSQSGSIVHMTKAYDGILIQKGKVGNTSRSKYLYFLSVNMDEISKGILAERMIYAVRNLRDILNNYKDNDYRNSYLYKVKDYKEYLKSHTLYLRRSELYEDKLNTRESISKLYPYDFEIVSDEEWMEAIMTKKENVLYLEHLGWGTSREVDVRTTQGELLITSFGWIPPIRLSRRNFRILFSK